MMWIRKFAAILIVSLGVALAVLPFPAVMEGEHTVEVVMIEVGPAPMDEDLARTVFGENFFKLDYESLEEAPGLQEAVLSLMGDSGWRCASSEGWRGTFGALSAVSGQRVAYAFRDGLWEVTNVEHRTDETDGELMCFEATLLGAYDNHEWNPMTRLEPSALEAYPEVKAELERLAAAGRIPEVGGRSIPPAKWRRFHHKQLDGLEYRPSFVVLGKLFSGAVEDEQATWTLKTPWLRRAAQVVGALALLLGFFLGISSYLRGGRTPGIPVSPGWFRVFCDVVGLACGLFCVTLVIDVLWVAPLGQPSLLGLNPEWPSSQPITGLHFVAIPGLLLALPLFSLWMTSLSCQRIHVHAQGITSYGALFKATLPWQDLESAQVREQKNPFAFTVVDFRKLQSVVDLEGKDQCITINEPPSRKRKADILNALGCHAPQDKGHLIDGLRSDW